MNLVQRYFLRFTSTVFAITSRAKATIIKILYADKQAPEVVAKSRGVMSKLAYIKGISLARVRMAARITVVKMIRARKAAAAVMCAKIPQLSRVRWRVLAEVDEFLLGALDDTILEDIDYISLDDVGKETNHG